MQYVFSRKLFNPLFWHLRAALRDPTIRYIYIEGGSSAGKTYTIAQALLTDTYEHDYGIMVFRRYHVDIPDSVYKSFKSAAKGLTLDEQYLFQQDLIKNEGATSFVRFRGLEDEEDIKGVEDIGIIYNNEWNQFTEKQWDQQKKRLRGRPNQKFINDWNPISDQLWQYKNVIDIDEWQDMPLNVEGVPYSSLDAEHSFIRKNKAGNTVWIKTTYRDNFWVVGRPDGKAGFIDTHTLAEFEHSRLHKPNMYRVYANGERGVMRTGGEFWKAFDETKHVRPMFIEDKYTLHVSCDQNASPYVTLSIWQPMGKRIRQVHELPCVAPDNNAPKSARRLAAWLRSIGYKDVVYVYGDPAGNSRSTVDYNSSSFFDKFIEVLQDMGYVVNNRVARSHPEVALSAAFINDIYEFDHEGYSIEVSDDCKVSMRDYATVQEDKDGTMLKTKVKDKETGRTYEPIGHFSDAKRYFIISYLAHEFNNYKVRGRNRVPVAVDY